MKNAKFNPSIMFIAGDPSGDVHASAAVKEIKGRRPSADVWGVGGQSMRSAGFDPVLPFAEFNRMGYAEVLPRLPFFFGAKRKLLKAMAGARRPDVLVCVDYSGFNMPMMKEARGMGIPVVWYIAPMVWAWKRKRAATLGALASHIAVIFPFEERYFSPYAAPVTFVGNPLTESLPRIDAKALKFPGLDGFRVALAPGSRPQEIKHLLNVMIDAAGMLKARFPSINIAVSRFGGLDEKLFCRAKDAGFEIFGGPLQTLLRRSDLALAASGTATLEAALLGVPTVAAYRTSRVSYAIYKKFVTIDSISLPNITAGKTIIPECVQEGATPKKLYCEAERLMSMPRRWEETARSLSALRTRLGEKKPSKELADIIFSFLP